MYMDSKNSKICYSYQMVLLLPWQPDANYHFILGRKQLKIITPIINICDALFENPGEGRKKFSLNHFVILILKPRKSKIKIL